MKPEKNVDKQKGADKKAETTLEDLIEKKKLENAAYRKILKSLNTNKNK